MNKDITFCEDCDNLHSDRNGHPRYWMCGKQPRKEGFGFVTKGTWDKMSPFMYGSDINGGDCRMFEPKKEL